jgi:glycosyltransferase involved in cell wall biosynthesis
LKILIAAERCGIFFEKYIDNMAEALVDCGVTPVLLAGEAYMGRMAQRIDVISSEVYTKYASNFDEHRYLEVFEIASKLGINHVHFIFLFDPQRLFLALNSILESSGLTFTYSIFGLAEYARKPIYANIHEKMLNMKSIRRVLLHSIAPNVAKKLSSDWNILQSPKVSFVHDPLYDPPSAFKLSKLEARQALQIPEKQKVLLYFGTYYRKKGADLLLAAADACQDLKGTCFLFVGNTQTAPPDFNHTAFKLSNVRVDDRTIDEDTAYKYFIAADLIIQPYRKEYQYDTSGVLVQASLAKRPTLVPDIAPFKEVVEDYRLGLTFNCEQIDSLIEAIRGFHRDALEYGDYDEYVNSIESWKLLAQLILE